MSRLYDEKCHDLAKYFTVGEERTAEQVSSLAQEIQDSIEGWLEMHPSPNPLCDNCGHTKNEHWDRYGCTFERGDEWVTGNQPEAPTCLMAQGPCCCTDFKPEEIA